MISTEGSLCLPSLEKLHVENCEELVEIVAKDGAAIEEANKELIIFPSLSSLKLWNLPRLRCIYPGMRILEWPMLKVLNVIHCQMLKIFATVFQNSPVSYSEGEDSFPTDQQSFVSLEKVTPRLEELPLGKEEAKMIEEGKLHVDLQELHTLTLQCFHDKSDVFPFVFRSKAPLPNPKFLMVRHSDFQEIFPSQPPERIIILSQLQGLELWSLPLLKSIGLQYPWMDPFLKNLKFLYVFNCDRLTNLTVPSTTLSFSNLLKLHVTDCHGLKHLFTSSTAKTFCVLKEVLVTNCEIEEIMAKEEGDKPEELEFKQLETLTLCLLQKLESFYSGNFTLNFSSLKRVFFTKCRNKKIFRPVDILPNELEVQIDGVHSKGCQQVQQIIPMSTSLPNELACSAGIDRCNI
ncbi:Leucine-rich repeat domain superfamily [Sesbania bispinosa]|nr:Leucine-rich repeat domain superfamily [Sesbania bispinosa]